MQTSTSRTLMKQIHQRFMLVTSTSSTAAAAVPASGIVERYNVNGLIRHFASSTATTTTTTSIPERQTTQSASTRSTSTATSTSSSSSSVTPCQADWVKEAIKKMVSDRSGTVGGYGNGSNSSTCSDIIEDMRPIDDEELEERFQEFQNLYKEAELCIADLKEAKNESNDDNDDDAKRYDDELECAQNAVENVFIAYIDLLDDLRHRTLSDTQLRAYNDVRSTNACNLKKLREAVTRESTSAKKNKVQ